VNGIILMVTGSYTKKKHSPTKSLINLTLTLLELADSVDPPTWTEATL